MLVKPSTGPLLALSTTGSVTLEGFRVVGDEAYDVATVTVGSNTSLRVVDVEFDPALVKSQGTLEVRSSRFLGGAFNMTGINCMNGTLTIADVEFVRSTVEADVCQLQARRSRFDEVGDGSIRATGGVVTIENNLIINDYEYADSMHVRAVAPGSVIRFNTFVNTSGVDSDGVALYCDETVGVENNVFAYRSMHPIGGIGCGPTFSLFDQVAVPTETVGEGNRVADAATFFVDPSGRDYHLAGASPAKSIGRATSLDHDHERNVRPRPAGSQPDVGCYEAP